MKHEGLRPLYTFRDLETLQADVAQGAFSPSYMNLGTLKQVAENMNACYIVVDEDGIVGVIDGRIRPAVLHEYANADVAIMAVRMGAHDDVDGT